MPAFFQRWQQTLDRNLDRLFDTGIIVLEQKEVLSNYNKVRYLTLNRTRTLRAAAAFKMHLGRLFRVSTGRSTTLR